MQILVINNASLFLDKILKTLDDSALLVSKPRVVLVSFAVVVNVVVVVSKSQFAVAVKVVRCRRVLRLSGVCFSFFLYIHKTYYVKESIF